MKRVHRTDESSASDAKQPKTVKIVAAEEVVNMELHFAEQFEIEGLEYKLYDVLDHIFQYLPAKSLCSVARVSRRELKIVYELARSWNDAARREINKRNPKPLDRVLLPVLYNENEPRFNVQDHFITRPNTIIMFCAPAFYRRSVIDLESTILAEYHKRLSSRIVMVSVDHARKDEEQMRSCFLPKIFLPSGEMPPMFRNILGLRLPENRDFTIKIAECTSRNKNVRRNAKKVFQMLQPDDNVRDPIFLLFSHEKDAVASRVLKMFQDKYTKKPIKLWGCPTYNIKRSNDNLYPNNFESHSFLGILLHSSKLQAHCLVLQFDDKHTMEQKLSNFQRNLKLRRRNVGLACGPRELHNFEAASAEYANKVYYSPKEMMAMVKLEFPTVEFTGIFNDPEYRYYGCDRMTKDTDYKLEHSRALSIMILSYD